MKRGFVKVSIQIIHTIYYVNLYFPVIYNTLYDLKHINNMGCFEANLTQQDIETLLLNKMLIKIK